MQEFVVKMLCCPACHDQLAWEVREKFTHRIIHADASCAGCGAVYQVREGIGNFVVDAEDGVDLWQQVDSALLDHLEEHPEVKKKLLYGPVDALSPADQFFRSMALEELGEFEKSRTLEAKANHGIYTEAYMACWDSQIEYVVKELAQGSGPVVDIASGHGYLAEKILLETERPMIITDFSPHVLRRNKQWLESVGEYHRVSLLAFDARQTPFKDDAVSCMTTNLGLPNIENPGDLMKELGRVMDGRFLAISHFFPEIENANAELLRQHQLEEAAYKRLALEAFQAAGWQVTVENGCTGLAKPTAASELLDGIRIDGLPVVETDLEWCVLSAAH